MQEKKRKHFLKKLDNGFKSIKDKENKILEEEKNNSTKKIISSDEIKKKLQN